MKQKRRVQRGQTRETFISDRPESAPTTTSPHFSDPHVHQCPILAPLCCCEPPDASSGALHLVASEGRWRLQSSLLACRHNRPWKREVKVHYHQLWSHPDALKKVSSRWPVAAVCIFNSRSSQPRCLVLENHLLVPAYADGNSERQEVWPEAEAASGGAHYTEHCTNAATAADLVQGGQ